MSNLRIPPYSQNAEDGVLGSMLLDPSESIAKAFDTGLRAEAFYERRNQELYAVICELDGNRTDVILIAQKLRDSGVLEKVGGYERLIELQGIASVAGHVESYSKIVMEKHRARILIENCTDTIEEVYDGASPDLIAMSHIGKVENIAPPTRETMASVIDDATSEIEAIVRGELKTLPFPWRNFNQATFGIPLKAVTPMLGRDKTGKSRLAMALVAHWLGEGIPTLVFSFEDGRRRYLHALAATIGEYDAFTIRRRPSSDYMSRCMATMERLKSLPIYVVEQSMNAEDVVATIAEYKRKHGIRAVVIDGFKDISESKGENRTTAENHIFETIKKGAMRYDVGVLQIEHPHDVEDGKWLSRRNIRGSKQRSHSARMFLVFQDCGIPEAIRGSYALGDGEGFIVLDCQACSYGERSFVVLKPELEKGRFDEIRNFEA